MSEKEKINKIVIAGDGCVEKTTLLNRFYGDIPSIEYIATLGVQIREKAFEFNEENGSKVLNAQFWDLSGQPAFSEVRKTFYNGARGVILVYDISNKKSFDSIENWMKEIVNQVVKSAEGYVVVEIIANKIDLRGGSFAVTEEEGLELTDRLSEYYSVPIEFLECSAIDGIKVDDAFHSLAQRLYEYYG